MPVVTRSQSKQSKSNYSKLEEVPRNAKGHPAIGHLRPKQQKEINPWIYECDGLCITIGKFIEAYETKQYVEERNKIDSTNYEIWCDEIYKKLFDYISIDSEISFIDINYLLLLCRFLIENELFEAYEQLIINCPENFMLAYANNSERTPNILMKLKNKNLNRVCKYILSFTDDSKLKTWNERRNAHIRGNLLYQSLF